MVLYILYIILFWALCEAMECNQICLQNSSTDFYNTPATFRFVPLVSPFKVYRLLTITDKYTKQKEIPCFLGHPGHPVAEVKHFQHPRSLAEHQTLPFPMLTGITLLVTMCLCSPLWLRAEHSTTNCWSSGGHRGLSWTDNCVCLVCVCYWACVGGGKWPEATSQGGGGRGNWTPWPLLNTPL